MLHGACCMLHSILYHCVAAQIRHRTRTSSANDCASLVLPGKRSAAATPSPFALPAHSLQCGCAAAKSHTATLHRAVVAHSCHSHQCCGPSHCAFDRFAHSEYTPQRIRRVVLLIAVGSIDRCTVSYDAALRCGAFSGIQSHATQATQGRRPEFVAALLLRLELVSFAPKDVVYSKGDDADKMCA